jgi:hypothetical protein
MTDQVAAQRLRVVAVAEAEIGKQEPAKYWEAVLPEQHRRHGYHGEWCGGFALWCLRQAGLAPNLPWVIGKGFCYTLPTTRDPQPGDVAYIDKPFQHHAVVAAVVGDQVTTIDGNQYGSTVALRTRARSAFTFFFSIAPLLEESTT